MTTEKFCLDDELGVHAHYEIPREAFDKLQALALVMDKQKETAPFAKALRSLLAQIVCVLDEK